MLPFKITEENLRVLARTAGDPLPDALRRQVEELLPTGETAEFYVGFVTGLNLTVHLINSINDAGALKGCVSAVAIQGARFYMVASGVDDGPAAEGDEGSDG
ncbi:MAG TPA: hypothetical protein VF668_01360 [Pyrinomonadaceae bacterium]|jgi:hypothetical protein